MIWIFIYCIIWIFICFRIQILLIWILMRFRIWILVWILIRFCTKFSWFEFIDLVYDLNFYSFSDMNSADLFSGMNFNLFLDLNSHDLKFYLFSDINFDVFSDMNSGRDFSLLFKWTLIVELMYFPIWIFISFDWILMKINKQITFRQKR